MLCLSGFEPYSRWVPLIIQVTKQREYLFSLKKMGAQLTSYSLRSHFTE